MEEKYIHLKINEEWKQQLKKEATEKGLSLNAYLRLIISERKK